MNLFDKNQQNIENNVSSFLKCLEFCHHLESSCLIIISEVKQLFQQATKERERESGIVDNYHKLTLRMRIYT